ncbi:sugar isomerase [Allokutzneria sp. A3M-2-11 16]|uniref:polysaccharide lyase n=1 Tax=Allokutzneria sp. A3M-2-11 16 TaxID=2962043 RepID=UPI0020B66013|nr:sugar isomerase [Allokutzneria sp. A3M-2-11 16]MCP3803551.1 sugar isomerase [Allokutzneria sp. A3M-2-11 16]
MSLGSRLRGGLLAFAVLAGMTTGTPATAAPAPWSGGFSGFPSTSWSAGWGIDHRGKWGFNDMKASGSTLDVTYGKGSSAPSCKNCPTTGGGQFYQDLNRVGRADLQRANTLYLRYQVRFPTGYDFGKGGKLPGFYGGDPGSQSGGNHGGWSTRFMWRGGGKGEVYVYTPKGNGYGKDVGLGSWSFAADGRTHTIEQAITRSTGNVTVWYDGRQVLSANEVDGIGSIPFRGVFFSTFFGGHDTSWGPKSTVHAHFSNFTVSASR